ncbi:MAG: sigma-70 family RNA polymerase sigma factor, partial [Myxococcota bacterium]
ARKAKRKRELSLNETLGKGSDEGASYQDLVADEGASVSHMSYERHQFVERLKQALAQLPEDQRTVFVLKEINGLKFREIAEVVDAPVPTVKSRMRYALQALRGHMEAYRDHHFDEEERREVAGTGE